MIRVMNLTSHCKFVWMDAFEFIYEPTKDSYSTVITRKRKREREREREKKVLHFRGEKEWVGRINHNDGAGCSAAS